MSTQSISDQTLIEKIRALPPEKVSEVLDFVEFLAQKQEALRQEEAQDAEDGAEVRRRQANSDPAERRTLHDLRQTWNQRAKNTTKQATASSSRSWFEMN